MSRGLLATVDPGLSRYTPERVGAFYTELVGRVAALPGVHSASIADAPLLSGSHIDGLSIEGSNDGAETSSRIVGPRFFETMGIHFRLGRDFSVDDRVASPKVAIVNETIARKYFTGQNPIGKHVGLGGIPDIEIVGIIGDTKYRALREGIPNTLYLPMDQAQFAGSERTLHVRTTADPGGMVSTIREQVRALDSNLPVKVRLFSDLVDENLVQERLIATLSGFFGGLALILTAIGLYGALAYAVQHRTHEIGIRISMGADRGALIWMILRECLVIVIAGIAIGLPASLWLSTLVRSQLFGLIPHDTVTLTSAIVLIVVVAALAGYLPARRASRVDPIVALRCE
jgi:predicted permease